MRTLTAALLLTLLVGCGSDSEQITPEERREARENATQFCTKMTKQLDWDSATYNECFDKRLRWNINRRIK
jgi:nitrous oxide reductase accessory protein NosL